MTSLSTTPITAEAGDIQGFNDSTDTATTEVSASTGVDTSRRSS